MDRARIRAYEVFVGIDVGKSSNYIAAFESAEDEPFLDMCVSQDEESIREALARAASHGRTLVTVDQCGTFGRLSVAVAKGMGLDVAHVPPRKFDQIAEGYGEDKDDPVDARIMAEVARSSPKLIGLVEGRPEVLAQVRVLASARRDSVAERTRCYNRLHDMINQVCPPLEKVFSKYKLRNNLEIRLLERYGGPSGLRKAGKARCAKWAASIKYQRTHGPEKVGEIFDAIAGQTVRLPAADAIERQIKRLAARVVALNVEIGDLEAEIEALSEQIPEVGVLRSIPGVGRVYGAVIAAEIGGISRFGDSAHLAAYAGLAPVRRKSGTSVNGKRKRIGGNRQLKNALVQSADRARGTEEWARSYYDKKRGEGKKHRQALLALARRRVDLVYAMLSNGTYYEPRAERA